MPNRSKVAGSTESLNLNQKSPELARKASNVASGVNLLAQTKMAQAKSQRRIESLASPRKNNKAVSKSEKPGSDAEKPGKADSESIDMDELIKAQEAQDRGKSLQMKQGGSVMGLFWVNFWCLFSAFGYFLVTI